MSHVIAPANLAAEPLLHGVHIDPPVMIIKGVRKKRKICERKHFTRSRLSRASITRRTLGRAHLTRHRALVTLVALLRTGGTAGRLATTARRTRHSTARIVGSAKETGVARRTPLGAVVLGYEPASARCALEGAWQRCFAAFGTQCTRRLSGVVVG